MDRQAGTGGDATLVLSERMHDWVLNTYGVDPRVYQPVPSVAPAAPVPAVAPAEAEADLRRRLAKSQALYRQYGQTVADDMLGEKDRLTAAEARIGPMTREHDVTLAGDATRIGLSERGVTLERKQSAGLAEIGPDGKVTDYQHDSSRSTTIGLGNLTSAATDKTVHSQAGTTTTTTQQSSATVDLVKGERSASQTHTTEVKDADGTSKTTDKHTSTVGVSGATVTHEHSVQKGKELDSSAATGGLKLGAGQVGATYGVTRKTGEMSGPPEAQVMEKGRETATKGGAGLVSDAAGTGLGLKSDRSDKKTLGDGRSLTNTVGGGGRVQAIVKEVPNSNPPMFTITTTISLDATIGKGAGVETTPGKSSGSGEDTRIGGETTHKAGISASATVTAAATASFKRTLTADEAHDYLEAIKQNGRNSKLPEHSMLATGMTQGWDVVARLWAATGSADQAKKLKPGEEIEATHTLGGSVKAGVSGGQTATGGLSGSIDVSAGQTHKVGIKSAGLPDGMLQVTVSVDDSADLAAAVSAGYGAAKAGHGETMGAGVGRSLVFVLDPKAENFNAQFRAINHAGSIAELDAMASDPTFHVASRTMKDSASQGATDTVGLTLGGTSLNLGMTARAATANELTTGPDGKPISARSTGTGQSGVSLGLGEDLKASDSLTEGYTGDTAEGEMHGEITRAHTHSSAGKTLTNIAQAPGDPLGTVANPSKLVGEATDVVGMDVEDKELMGIVELARDPGHWKSQIGGYRQDEWIKTGAQIRAALTEQGGKVVAVDRVAIQKALAGWVAAKDGERTELLERLLRPFGATGHVQGKSFAFPEGTDSLKPEWTALVDANPLKAPKARAATDPQAALTDIAGVIHRLEALRQELRSKSGKWAGEEVRHAEMLGRLTERLNQAHAEQHSLEKHLAKAGGAPAISDHEADRRAMLTLYLNNCDQMRHYKTTVFNKLGEMETMLKDDSWFHPTGLQKMEAAEPVLKLVGDLIRVWGEMYSATYRMWETLAPATNIDKAKLEELHVHGAQMRLAEIRRLEQAAH